MPPDIPYSANRTLPMSLTHCQICDTRAARLTCAPCTQASLWPRRTEFLFLAAERDGAAERVHEYLEASGSARGALDDCRVKSDEKREEYRRINDVLMGERKRMEMLRAENRSRRRKLEAAREAALGEQARVDTLKAEIKRLNQKTKILCSRMAEARSFLCRDAAGLVGLRLKRRKSGKVEYLIGGVLIPNLLTDLSVHPHTSINVSLDHLARLVVLVSHYLGLKLPNEITLPHRGNPYTTVRGQLNNRHMAVRPLVADSPLPVMARENTTAHSKLVEGISMLALDIAWLCYSQGLFANEVEDASNIGYCMWKLLVAKDSTAVTSPAFGRMSHATINGNLTLARHEPVMAGFRLRYNLIADRIRTTLQGETMVADWDMVADAEEHDSATSRRRSVPDAEIDSFEDAALSFPAGPASSGGGVGKWTRIRSRNDGSVG